jgi:putative PIN family toxin of toxin-antitoxin system
MKIVLDTDVIIAALRSPTGASAELLRMARRKVFRPVISVPLILEYEAVAMRPEHLRASGLTRKEVGAVLDVLVDLSEWNRIHYAYRPILRDPGDEMVLETALNSSAKAIVTFNRNDFGEAPTLFNFACWLPREALEKLR